MNSTKLSIRAALAVLGTVFGTFALPAISQAGSVTVNAAQVCIDAPAMSMSPAGDLVITCTAAGTTPPPPPPPPPPSGAPVCTLPNQTVTYGQQATMTASCTNSPTSYSWTSTMPGFGPSTQASNTTGNIWITGTFQVTVTATNASGSSSATGSLTISPAGTVNQPPPIVGCATPTASVVADFNGGITWVELNIQQGGSVAVKLPQLGQGVVTELRSIQSTNTQSDLTDEISISTCPGDFNNVPAECKTWGTVWGSATYLRGYTSSPAVAGICSMTPGVQYYANVRNTKFDRVTPSCSAVSCNMKLQFNSY